MNSRVLGGLCAIAAFGLDQGTKALALNTPALERGVEVLPFLNLVRVLNDGVSFGMLGGIVPWWGLIALAGVIVAWLLIWFGVLISSFPPVWSVCLLAIHAGDH